MTLATNILMDEHRGIERMLTALERALSTLDAGSAADVPLFTQGVDFLSVFADHCHHHKEEQHLFPLLEGKGFAVGDITLGDLLADHDRGRALISKMNDAIQRVTAGHSAALADLAAAARAYTELLRGHIAKEDEVFKAAGEKLTADENKALVETFERVETEVMGVGTHERYHQMLDSLPE